MSVRLVCVFGAAGLLAIGCGSDKKKDTPAPTPTDTAEVDSAPPPEPPECKNPVDVLLYGKDPTGYGSCEGAGVFRKEQIDCPSKIPRTTTCGAAPVGDAAAPADCHADSDCTTKPNGYCAVSPRSSYCFCNYGCVRDSDCGDGYVCTCGDPVGTCVKATCHTDADCNGRHCLRSIDENCDFIFACQEATDPCTVNKDCPANAPACSVINGKRTCTTTFACK